MFFSRKVTLGMFQRSVRNFCPKIKRPNFFASNVIQNYYYQVCRSAELLYLNVEYYAWRTSTELLKAMKDFAKNYPPMEREREGWQCSGLICDVFAGCIGRRMIKFLLSLWGDQIYTCSYINIMYRLDSARRHGGNSTFESVLHFCRIMQQDQSKVRQKCCSRFRRRISVEINSVNLKKPTARMNWRTVKYYKGSRKMLSLNSPLPSS